MNNAEEIAVKIGVSTNSIYIYIRENNIHPVKKVYRTCYYNADKFSDLITRKYGRINHSKKRMHIIEYWILMRLIKTNEQISKELEIKENSLNIIIKEYINNDNCIIIKSKL